jgi:cysteinyl-tRNA synthetase
LGAALTRLKRLVMAVEALKTRHAELVSAPIAPSAPAAAGEEWALKQVQGDVGGRLAPFIARFDAAISDDLNTAVAFTVLDEVLALKKIDPAETLAAISAMDAVLGLGVLDLGRTDLRIRPKAAVIAEAEIEAALARRKEARATKDFATSDALRDDLAAKGVEVMDGDPLGWDWKLGD